MAILLLDDVLTPEMQDAVYSFLMKPTWSYGWKSNRAIDSYSFWHKHFAGNVQSDHHDGVSTGQQYECTDELKRNAPLLNEAWLHLQKSALRNHTLQRCYANGHPYGSEGTVHTDSISPDVFTGVYYPHTEWHSNWAGETVLFNDARTDVISSIYPKPNRLVVFPGTVPHVARGVSRVCPMLRVTLMFKFCLSP